MIEGMQEGDQLVDKPRYRGRALDLQHEEAEGFAKGNAKEVIQRYQTANAENGYNGLSASIRRTKAQIPDLNRAGAKTITDVMAKDLQGIVDTHGPDKKFSYVGIRHADGRESAGGISAGPDGSAQPQGQWVTVRPDGTRAAVIDFQNGKKHGVELLYNDKGLLVKKSMYQDGQKHGEEMQYDDEGKPMQKTMFDRGQAKQSYGLQKHKPNQKLPTFLRGR